ncbi:MAG: DUF4166 domain-containing protein [Gammaproteobacteria bacterium]|nr:DUF4166 domain-containing protein [Gammaproteobacteria bacterium]
MSDLCVYKRVLGHRFYELPVEIQAMHDVNGSLVSRGACTVEAGSSYLSRIIARSFGFPPSGESIPARISMVGRGECEVWTREMGAHSFVSELSPGRGHLADHLEERFGALSFTFEVPCDAEGLSMELRRVTWHGMALPRWLWPTIRATERVADGRFRFDVQVHIPLLGPLIRYAGWFDAPR